MIQELSSLSFAIGKYILAAALMVIFYWFLFREKATFNNCRLYLLSIALVAILISQFSIVVYTPPAKIVEIEAVQSVPITTNNQNNSPSSELFQTAVLRTNTSPATQPDTLKKYINRLTIMNVALGIYIIVTSVLFILLLIQLFRILALKRRGNLITKDGFQVVESAEIPTPFSFYNTIFLSPNLTGSKLEMILKHEQWHIKHRHYLDVFIMEVFVRLFWFNPVLWWVRRELRNVSEFHADRSVLDEGQDLYRYQTVILEEVMGNNTFLANGFNNSFTKKRFIMMKNKYDIRFLTLRRILILPFLIAVFSLLSFTTGNSQVKYVVKNGSKSTQKVNPIASDLLKSNLSQSNILNADSTVTIKTEENLAKEIDKSSVENSISKTYVGIWNQTAAMTMNGKLIKVTSGNYKIIKADNTFYTLIVYGTNGTTQVGLNGTYTLTSDSTCTEKIIKHLKPSFEGKESLIVFRLKDENTMLLKWKLNNLWISEEWTRIQLADFEKIKKTDI